MGTLCAHIDWNRDPVPIWYRCQHAHHLTVASSPYCLMTSTIDLLEWVHNKTSGCPSYQSCLQMRECKGWCQTIKVVQVERLHVRRGMGETVREWREDERETRTKRKRRSKCAHSRTRLTLRCAELGKPIHPFGSSLPSPGQGPFLSCCGNYTTQIKEKKTPK